MPGPAALVAPLLLALQQLLKGPAASCRVRAPGPLLLVGFGPVAGCARVFNKLALKLLKPAALQELTLQLEAITGPIAQAEPAAARELLGQFLELGNNVLGRCDDSSGLLGDEFRQTMGQLGRLTEVAPPDPATLAEQVFEAFCDNGYGVFDGAIAPLKQALGPEGLTFAALMGRVAWATLHNGENG